MPHTGWAKLGWKGWGVPCPVSNPMVSAPLTPPPPTHPPRPQCWPARGERGSDGSLPPYAGPLAGLWRGERDEAGRGPLKHTPKVLFMSMLNLTENAHSQAHRVVHGESQLDRTGQTTDMWVRWVQKLLDHKSKLYNLHKTLSLFQEILPLIFFK